MLAPLTQDKIDAFTAACTCERVFGSKVLTALNAYGLDSSTARFFLAVEGEASAALYLAGGVLILSAADSFDMGQIAPLVRQENIHEVDARFDQCAALQKLLGGTLESSYYMVYRGGAVEGGFSDLTPGALPAVFDVLQRSHEYYRTHLTFEAWAGDLTQKLERGLMELYQLERDGEVVGTGSIISEDEECGVIAAVAVVPEWRHKGLGAHISRFLTKRILEKGKTPRLISGYDEVAELYRQVGYETCGRWGELYL